MKQKTKERLARKWDNLPLHYIDSCIIVDIILNNKNYQKSKSYTDKLGKRYGKGVVSLLTLGEIVLAILNNEKNYIKRQIIFGRLTDLIDSRNINICSSSFIAYDLAIELQGEFQNLEPSDALHLAITIKKNAHLFATNDKDIISNRGLMNKYSLKIISPIHE